MSDTHSIFMSKQHNRENDTVAVDAATEKSDVALREEAILAFWREHDIFNKTLKQDAPNGEFIFYDGPPFATGLPHYGHILASTIKDAVPRFWTMNGFHVPRKWGWDCHGLPLENLIEKKLGLATKRDIEAYGVKNFNEAARDTVMEYADEWRRIIPRMGRWVDMENDYKTMDSTYTESVWWVFSELNKKGLVFEGFKSMHLCPRCGTTLSNFEVNQGYKDIKDIAVTVKLALLDETGNVTDTNLLVWTTTPWTLPGNMAAAVHRDIDYVKVKISLADQGTIHSGSGTVGQPMSIDMTFVKGEYYILAKARLAQLGTDTYEVVEEMKGSDLVGKSYQPPFPYLGTQDFDKTNAWKIWHADYVELGSEGTGAVHIAPAYGDDDMQLAKANNIPIVHHVSADGHFMDFVTDFAGKLVKPKDDDTAGIDHKDADIEILRALQAAGKIFKKENITHSYPHCWRCDTPLLNYATTSWFVNVPRIKDELVAANNTVLWVPEHVGRARFGNWLEGARDWAVSRQRYWGAPLPIWRHPKTCVYKVFGTLEELLAHTPKRNNHYIVMRHAEALSNLSGIIDALGTIDNPLTEKGQAQCKEAAENLRKKGITKIIHSGLQRGRETAEVIARELGLSSDVISADARMLEFQVGTDWEGKLWTKFNENFGNEAEKFSKHIAGTETRQDLIKRVGDFLYEFDATHTDETVLVIGHGSSVFALRAVAEGADLKRVIEIKEEGYFANAEIREVLFTPLPHNDSYELDYHRPYIDDFVVVDEGGEQLIRIPDVFDCWFESGSMPYGQQHYLGRALPEFDPKTGKGFPAQFIAEGLDQTRGWFYSLIVLGTALFGRSPYENVIVNGLIMAEDGKKLSKKLQNYSAPMDLADRVGADAMRLYLLSSPVVRAEDVNFSDREVLDLQRKTIGRLHNVLAMYEMYADGTTATPNSTNILDRWILARLYQLIVESAAGYKAYELDRATRPVIDFIDDLSVWYLRRSRDRFKGSDVADKTAAVASLRFVLCELAKVMAPVMPFYAEHLYLAVRDESEPESVHLTKWPEEGEIDLVVLGEMSMVREFVTLALEARTKANIKVRQPLATLYINVDLEAKYANIIAEEVNVKKVVPNISMIERIQLDTQVTSELKAEGDIREFMRAVQDMRKQADLRPSDVIKLTIDTSPETITLLHKFEEIITKTIGAQTLIFARTDGVSVTAGKHTLIIKLEKVG